MTIQSPFFTVDVCTGRVWGGQLLLYYDIGAVDFAQNHVFCIANPFFCPYFHEICYFNSFYQYFGWVMGVFAQQGPKTSLFKENYAHYWIFYYLKLHPPWLLAWTPPPPRNYFFSSNSLFRGFLIVINSIFGLKSISFHSIKASIFICFQNFQFLCDYDQNSLHLEKSSNRKIPMKCSFQLLFICTTPILNHNCMQNKLLLRKYGRVRLHFSQIFDIRGKINFLWTLCFYAIFCSIYNFCRPISGKVLTFGANNLGYAQILPKAPL